MQFCTMRRRRTHGPWLQGMRAVGRGKTGSSLCCNARHRPSVIPADGRNLRQQDVQRSAIPAILAISRIRHSKCGEQHDKARELYGTEAHPLLF